MVDVVGADSVHASNNLLLNPSILTNQRARSKDWARRFYFHTVCFARGVLKCLFVYDRVEILNQIWCVGHLFFCSCADAQLRGG